MMEDILTIVQAVIAALSIHSTNVDASTSVPTDSTGTSNLAPSNEPVPQGQAHAPLLVIQSVTYLMHALLLIAIYVHVFTLNQML